MICIVLIWRRANPLGRASPSKRTKFHLAFTWDISGPSSRAGYTILDQILGTLQRILPLHVTFLLLPTFLSKEAFFTLLSITLLFHEQLSSLLVLSPFQIHQQCSGARKTYCSMGVNQNTYQ